jgi:UDP-glucose 4-epimerase
MDMPRVLIVGGGGFIGRHAIRLLAASGYSVFATFRSGRPVPSLQGVRWLPCDLAAADPTAGWPKTVDALIFLAQSSSWRSFPGGSQDVFAVNVAGLMQAAWYAQRAEVRRFIYVSSGTVYGPESRPASEGEPIDLLNLSDFYPASKLAGEVLLRPFQSQFATIILRLFMPYGGGQSPTMLPPRLLRSVRGGWPVQLHGADGLLANPVAVADVAKTLERCLRLDLSHTLNVAGPERLTLRAICETIGTMVGRAPVFEPQAVSHVPVYVGDTTALKTVLGWAPATGLEAGLRQWMAEECSEPLGSPPAIDLTKISGADDPIRQRTAI